MLANGFYTSLASYLATWNGSISTPIDTQGAVLRAAGFPENFIYTNPQFAAANWTANLLHSNYHSLQVQATMRPVQGISFTGTYTWSRNLGVSGGFTNPRDIASDYAILGMHREHTFVSYGTLDLPIGPNRLLLRNSSGALGRIAGGWQLSWIANVSTGIPFSVSDSYTYWFATGQASYANGVPDFVGPAGSFDTKSGGVLWEHGARTGNYFDNRYVSVTDPQCSSMTTKNGLKDRCILTATALKDNPGVLVFQNPQPLQRGNFGRNNLTGPTSWNVDLAMTKVIKVTEGKSIQFRVDASNVFNHPMPSYGSGVQGVRIRVPSAPLTNIGKTMDYSTFASRNYPFGYLDSKVGNRSFQARIRFDF
jgi:hypothetical protein